MAIDCYTTIRLTGELMAALITTRKLSDETGISIYTLQKWAREKKIPVYNPSGKLLMFDIDEVTRTLKKSKIN